MPTQPVRRNMPVQAPAAVVPGPKRLSLADISLGREKDPIRMVLYAPPGLGKTTFAAGAPKPIFIPVENGLKRFRNIPRFPKPESWADMTEDVRFLTDEEHEFETLVIDTADAAEPLLWQKICTDEKVKSIEKVGGGYGKGFTAVLEHWDVYLKRLEILQERRGMNVIILCHSQVKNFNNPAGDDYQRYILRMHEKSAGRIVEWADDVCFANLDVATVKDDKTKRVKGISSGARLLYTNPTAYWFAKTRSGLTDRLPLSWSEFAAAVERGGADPAALIEAIRTGGEGLPDELRVNLDGFLKAAGQDGNALVQLNNWVHSKLAEFAEESQGTDA